MTRSAIRLTLRLHALELAGFAVALAVLTAAAVFLAGQLEATGFGSRCVTALQAGLSAPVGCESAGRTFYDLQARLVSPVTGLLVTVAFGAPAFIGVLIIGRELERGTTRLAWSLAPSRWRWFVDRTLPILVVVGVMTLFVGIAMDRLTGAMEPGLDISHAFAGFGQRGGLIASRAIFILALAVLSGALLGRVLPALMLAIVLSYGGLAFGTRVHDEILRHEAIAVPELEARPKDRYIDQRFQLPDGSLIGWEAMYELDPPPSDNVEWIPRYPLVALVIPGERYRFVELREAAALAGGSFVALGLASLVVSRRRPG